ncbi:hypothetical protein BaRGS_00026628 [Batillaria attramentaria]|uniref:AB hydrolase-1 domain-containing protein n=1 Tax=Batillaria attramentaria TaxID=370345 RepID=A0ABD0K506_9CAEN
MSMLVAAFVGLCLYGMIRILNLASPSLQPNIYARTRNSEFVQAILSSCPILREPYVPPLLWGKSGHIQTIVYAKVGRSLDPLPSGVRHTKTLTDGSTLTFDLYEPTAKHKSGGEYCMLVCPGFGSSSESAYIRALTHHAQSSGYRVAALNHLGSLFNVRLTAPRIFSYGGWEEFHIMRQEVERLYPQCKLILVGLSMGANIVLKYLGERPVHQDRVWCAISICQGYNINAAKCHLMKWESMRRAYLHVMTANQLRLIRHHGDILLEDSIRRMFNFDVKKIFSATTLEELDLHYTCIPLILLNTEDDPIVPPPLFKYARDFAENRDNAVFVTTKHGGHLGYFEGGYLRPKGVTWLDRFVCEIADAVVGYREQREGEKTASSMLTEMEGKAEQLVCGTDQDPDPISKENPMLSGKQQGGAEMNMLKADGTAKTVVEATEVGVYPTQVSGSQGDCYTPVSQGQAGWHS